MIKPLLAVGALTVATLGGASSVQAACTLNHPGVTVKEEFENGSCLYRTEVYVEEDDISRAVYFLVPYFFSNHTNKPRLVVDFHGYPDTANGYATGRRSCWDEKAHAERNVIVAYPDGDFGAFESGDYCCGYLNPFQRDDVAFTRRTVAHVKNLIGANFGTSQAAWNVYAAGWSGGGAMAHFLACEANDLFDGAAPTSQSFALENPADCIDPGETPIPVFDIRAQYDEVVPFDGGESLITAWTRDWVSARDSRVDWFSALGCGISDMVEFTNYDQGAIPYSSNQLLVDIWEYNGLFEGDLYCIQGDGCGDEFMQCAVPTGHYPYDQEFPDGSSICDAAWQFFGEPSRNNKTPLVLN